MITMATAEQALKIYYLDVLKEQLDTKPDPLYNMITKTSKDVVGKEVRKMAPFGLNGGIGAGTETGNLPKSAGKNYIQFVSDTKNMYGTIQISDKSIQASSNNAGAFVNLLNNEIDSLLRAAKFNLSRMLHGDGTGILATTAAVTGALSFTVDDITNLMEGQMIDLLDSGVAITNGSGRRIAALDRATKTVYLDSLGGNVTTQVTTKVTIQGSYNLEITGLKKIFATGGTLYGVDRTANYWMNPYSVAATEGKITDSTIQKVIDYLVDYMGSTIDFILTSSGVKRAYQDYLDLTKRNVNIQKLDGGYSELSYNGIPLTSSRFATAQTMKMLNTQDFALHQMGDWRWLNDVNGKILTQIAGTPNWTATLVKYAELINDHPGALGQLTGITES